MMRILRMVVLIAFAVVTVAFGYVKITEYIKTDKTRPVIEIENADEILVVKLNAKDKDLLKGVTAYDEKDGDLTDKVVVESVSRFTSVENAICKVTYAVCDSNNHVASATRRIKYKNYESPKFYLTESLCYSLYQRFSISAVVGATDCLDGDIKNNVIVSSSDYTSSSPGTFTLNAKVENSKGDMTTIQLPMIVEDRSLNSPTIELKDYLIYVNTGDKINYRDYLVNAIDSVENDITSSVWIDSEYSKNSEPGVYIVNYYVRDSMAREGHTTLIVVAEDK